MGIEEANGKVLVVSDDAETAETLCRWVTEVGEQPVSLAGAEHILLERGTDETIDLIVTNLQTDIERSSRLLERLLDGDLFFGVPQLHLLHDAALRQRIYERNPDLAAAAIDSPPAAEEFQARVRLASEVGRLRRELGRASVRDPLTGSHNRRYLRLRLEQELSRCRRHGTQLSLVLFEIDDLKTINERYGDSIGDRVLRQVNQVLAKQVRFEDVHGRWDGRSFATILAGIAPRGAAVFANKVRVDTEAFHIDTSKGGMSITLSAGVSSYSPNRATAGGDDLVQAAERARDEAQERGGNRVFIDEVAMRGERRMVVVADTDRELLDLAEDLLSMDDVQVVRAESAEALEETLRFRRPDLLIVDVEMLDTAGEKSPLERLHAAAPDQPVPVVGLFDAPVPTRQTLGRLGIDRYLTKPFSVSILRAIARELIQRRPRR